MSKESPLYLYIFFLDLKSRIISLKKVPVEASELDTQVFPVIFFFGKLGLKTIPFD